MWEDSGKALSEDWSRLLTTFSYHGLVPDLHAHAWLSDHVIQLGSHQRKSLLLTLLNYIEYHGHFHS